MSLKRVLGDEEVDELELYTLVLLDHLCVFSLPPLLKICIKMNPVKIFYFEASKLGLGWALLLKKLNLVSGNPKPIKDYILTDTPQNGISEIRFNVFEACKKYQLKIKKLVDECLPKVDSHSRSIYETGVRKKWQLWLEEIIFQRDLGKYICQNSDLLPSQVILVSRFAYLLKIVGLDSQPPDNIMVIPQPFESSTLKYLFGPVIFSTFQIFTSLIKLLPFQKNEITNEEKSNGRIGVAAAWGFEGSDKKRVDDFFWWRQSKIPSKRLLYMFERPDYQPTVNRISELNNLGIEWVTLNKKNSGTVPHSMVINKSSGVAFNLKMTIFYSALVIRGLFGNKFTSSVVSLVVWQHYKSDKLSNIYKNLRLECLFHLDEAGFEHTNLAARKSGAVRIGIHWSCFMNPHHSTIRCHEVMFVWGSHNLKIILDSDSSSKIILISGCYLTESSYKNEHLKGRKVIQTMKDEGVRYTLTLFDNSLSVPNFYNFFLQWLLEDPNLGLIIKRKGKAWIKFQNSNTKELIQQAIDTGRIYIMDKDASPADAALLTDFAVGVTGVSAIAVAALQGARVLYLDFEHLDKGILKPYTLFHSLGQKRCVFFDPQSIKEAVLEYFNNPESNPGLGDASPILDQLDPFRDGKASQRIGEYTAWYLEGLDQGLSKDKALKTATNKYAEKWGQDKVIKSL
ncbi:MAG: hypothetical protein HOK41_06365 [Nitrospina sp.]|nr:hypothetical protein [Nitrospina sp.]